MAYSNKKTVLQLVALLKAFQIKQIVLSPGSRNAPFIQTFSQHDFFQCHTILDERNAAFYALGIIQQTRQPVVLCCTSGSAVLNYAPAIAEAYYQRLPLIIISADRTTAWLGQMDGQTLPQFAVFKDITQYSTQLPEGHTPEEEWFCNRLINEALIAVTAKAPLPVHLNVPLAEPLFDYDAVSLPAARMIHYYPDLSADLIQQFQRCEKIMIIVGQQFTDPVLTTQLEALVIRHHCVVLAEHLSNQNSPYFIQNFDVLLTTTSTESLSNLIPTLLITFGGHIVSKQLKQLLRRHRTHQHWHISPQGEIVDLFQSLSAVIAAPINQVINTLNQLDTKPEHQTFLAHWQQQTCRLPAPDLFASFSDISVIGQFIKQLPKNSALHIANSSPVRHLERFPLDPSIRIFCNRGVNGIDGTLSTVLGFAALTNEPVYLIIGDLSFFYNIGALWNVSEVSNLRILLVNNHSGGIFHLLPKLNQSSALNEYVATTHNTEAEKWADAAGFAYLQATDQNTYQHALKTVMQYKPHQPVILEVVTEIQATQHALADYYQQFTR